MSNPLYYPNRDMLASGFPTNWTLLKRLMWVRIMRGGSIPPEYLTVTGNPVTFETVRPAKLRQLKVAFSPVQSLNGYDSPWPAGGGAQLLNPAKASHITPHGITVTFSEDGTITINGTATDYNYLVVPLDTPLPAGDYTMSWFNAASQSGIEFSLRAANNTSAGLWNVPNSANKTITGTTTVEAVFWQLQINNGTTFSNFKISPMVVAGSTPATSYAPYSNICPISGWDSLTVYHSGADTSNPQTISITIGSTVYSGTVDVLTGVVTVDRGSLVVDGSTSLSVASNQICSIASQFKGMASAEVGLYKSDTFKAHINSGVANMNNEFTVDGYHVILVKAPSLFTNTDEAKAYFTAHPTKFVALLATPQTIQLTPQQVSTLLGENNMWSNANGDLTVEYRSN